MSLLSTCDFKDIAKAVVVKPAHCVEISGQRVGMFGLQVLLLPVVLFGGGELFA